MRKVSGLDSAYFWIYLNINCYTFLNIYSASEGVDSQKQYTTETEIVLQTVDPPKYLNMETTNLHIMNEIQCKISSIAFKVPSKFHQQLELLQKQKYNIK